MALKEDLIEALTESLRETENFGKLKAALKVELLNILSKSEQPAKRPDYPREVHFLNKLVTEYLLWVGYKSTASILKTATQHLQEMVKLNLLVTGITQVLLGLITITFLWMYWYEPVLVFPKAWVIPISSFISFPTSIDGAIGLPFWFSVCKVFAKSTSTLITFKK